MHFWNKKFSYKLLEIATLVFQEHPSGMELLSTPYFKILAISSVDLTIAVPLSNVLDK